jgi:hypothetical protein
MVVPLDWLLEGALWTVYRTLRDILGLPKNDLQDQAAYQAVLLHPLTSQLLKVMSPKINVTIQVF